MRPAEAVVGYGVEPRLLALLAVSAALHAAALGWVRMPEKPRLEAPAMLAVLSASLRVATTARATETAAVREAAPTAVRREARQPVRRETLAQPAAQAAAGPTVAAAPAASRDGETPALPAPTPAPVAVAAVPAQPAAADAARLLENYGQRLSELFARQQQYPRLAALRGWEGEVRVRLSVARQGGLSAVRLERSSGYEVLDRHALAMIEEIGKLPPPPAEFSGDVQVVVPIQYKLRKPA